MDSFSVAGLDFQLVKADSVFIGEDKGGWIYACLLYTSPSPRDVHLSRMPSSA